MTWISTYTGRRVDPTNLRPEDVCIEDVAHHLALINRFTGATRVPYSVAEHCVRMSLLCPGPLSLECLLHDASEAYLCDVSRPVKRQLNSYKVFEARAEKTIREHFDLVGDSIPVEVKVYDNIMLAWEARSLGIVIEEDYDNLDNVPYFNLAPWPWHKAEREFLSRYRELTR